MKIFAVIIVARQCNGEYIVIKTDKGYTQASKADARLQEIKQSFVNSGGQKPVRISTPNGDIDCMCEAGAFEIDVED